MGGGRRWRVTELPHPFRSRCCSHGRTLERGHSAYGRVLHIVCRGTQSDVRRYRSLTAAFLVATHRHPPLSCLPPGVSELTDEPWKFEVDQSGRLKCLSCCASVTGSCGRPGHELPGLAARAREAHRNKPAPPQWKPAPQVTDGYGRLAGPREWGGGSQQQAGGPSVSPQRNGGAGRSGGAPQYYEGRR